MPFTACLTNTQQKPQRHTTPPPDNQQKGRATTKNIQTTPPHPRPDTKPGADVRGCHQMLASTIHLPNTPPTNPRPRTHVRDRRRGHTRTPTPGRASRAPQAGLIPQGPTACQHPTPTRTTQVPHNRSEQARTGCRTEDGPPRDAGASSMTPLSEHHQCHPDIRRVRGGCAP